MNKLRPLHTKLVLASVAAFVLGASSVHCGGNSQTSGGFGASPGTGGATGTGNATSTGGTGNTMTTGMGGTFGIDVMTMDYSAEQIYASDPPPMTCDGGGMPPPVGGTPQCPDDKNLPGCPCTQAGQMASCWTGLRKNRNHGICHDGMTTCVQTGESLAWGPCDGEQLPTGTTGKASCGCFSGGHWAIANLSPCFYTDGTTSGAISTIVQGGQIQCPSDFSMAPSQSWSTDTLQVDCTGSFTLCYTIKAGDGKNPQPSDCVITKACATAYYSTANQVQMWPDLKGWISSPSMGACVDQFKNTGGYGQMSVDGQSDECELVDKVFQTVTYCPLSCNDPNPPAMCAQCMAGGGGSF